MALRFLLAALALSLAVQAAPVRAGDALTPDQTTAVEGIVRDYLRAHPELVMEAIETLQARHQAEEARKAKEALAKSREELEHDPDTPVSGNPDGDVTIVEFFDYQCGYCKRVLPVIQSFVKDDGNIRLALKEFPILSEQSLLAARLAMAVWRTDKAKYPEFHIRLMSMKGALDESRVLKLATDMGLDADALSKAAKDPAIDKALTRNRALAQTLDITGTPAFIVGEHLVPGALDTQTLEQLVAAARAKNK